MTAKRILRVLMVSLAIVIAVILAWRARLMKHQDETQTVVQTPDFGTVPDFALTERSGRTVTRADLRGQMWVADFIFTRCAGPCPIISNEMAGLSAAYSTAPNLKFVTFTVDPDFDTADVLSEYAERFKADKDRWLFLTGPKEKLFRLIQEGFKLAVENEPGTALPPDITHSVYFALVDGEGRILGYYNSTSQDSVALLRKEIDKRR